jgi:hypothetical protein
MQITANVAITIEEPTPTTAPMNIWFLNKLSAAFIGASVGDMMGARVITVTTAADTPEKGFGSKDPAASVIIKNCVVSIVEKALSPPLTDLAAAYTVILIEATSVELLYCVSL